ncbi:HET-domain-containing protein [Trichodelitschia bisporula]|uniref:HET-domain-containing protein n=1 Tax=Trichodelitschia bisporula TaxID=703511 RepID=A0A6G1HIQ1_9PEZI|nr:HET-domain-containing protein [Trichodelitschia bisporula]
METPNPALTTKLGRLKEKQNHASAPADVDPTAPINKLVYAGLPLPDPLGSIRLVRLHQDPKTGAISGAMSVFEREDAPMYVALSYEWGPGPAEHEITVNGKPFFIRKNLADCFKAFCKPRTSHRLLALALRGNTIGAATVPPDVVVEDSLWFWIDQICINQSNLSERGHQVNLMDHVYYYAGLVAAWLGPCDDEALENDMKLNFATAQCTYWERLWIVQELSMAKAVVLYLGEREKAWRSYKSFLVSKMYQQGRDFGQMPAYNVMQGLFIMQNHKTKHGAWTLPELMWIWKRQKCTDPRDRVFAMLSLLGQERRDEFDKLMSSSEYYSKTVEQVHKAALAHHPIRRPVPLLLTKFRNQKVR